MTIVKINTTSPIAHICKLLGQIFEPLIIPGKPPIEGQVTSAKESVQALGANSTVTGRTFSDPGMGRVIPTPVAPTLTPVAAPVRVQAQRAGDLGAHGAIGRSGDSGN
jgi:hypothetical protein